MGGGVGVVEIVVELGCGVGVCVWQGIGLMVVCMGLGLCSLCVSVCGGGMELGLWLWGSCVGVVLVFRDGGWVIWAMWMTM